MSFTADELQSFNDILEQKLAAHRNAMEQILDQRIQALRREFEQRFLPMQQEVIRSLSAKLAEQQQQVNTLIHQRTEEQQIRFTQPVFEEMQRRQQQLIERIAGVVNQVLATRLNAIETLLSQQGGQPAVQSVSVNGSEQSPPFETIEVQTELPWEDLMEVFGKVIDERFASMNATNLNAIKSLEQYLVTQLHALQTQLHQEAMQRSLPVYNANITSVQDVFQSIQQLERIVESMQVAMTANNALLSNRLYHHQQLPLERAHPAATSYTNGANGTPLAADSGHHEM